MDNTEQIKSLLKQRLEEAEILCANQKFDGAFYLAGYSVELILKSKICESLGVPNLFNIYDEETNNIDSIGELRKIFKTHNLKFLLLLSGLKNRFEDEKAINRNFIKVNSLLFSNWNEQVRYRPCGFMQQDDIIVLINLLKRENGLIKWIEQQN